MEELNLIDILDAFDEKQIQSASHLFQQIEGKDVYSLDTLIPVTEDEFKAFNNGITLYKKTWREYYDLHPMKASYTLEQFLEAFEVPLSSVDEDASVIKGTYKYYFTI